MEVTPGSRIVRSYCGGHPREQVILWRWLQGTDVGVDVCRVMA